jgi:hypothetical protein
MYVPQVREDSPHWLIEETERIRRGLLRLRQNVVLLKDPEQRDAFYPRYECMWGPWGFRVHSKGCIAP